MSGKKSSDRPSILLLFMTALVTLTALANVCSAVFTGSVWFPWGRTALAYQWTELASDPGEFYWKLGLHVGTAIVMCVSVWLGFRTSE